MTETRSSHAPAAPALDGVASTPRRPRQRRPPRRLVVVVAVLVVVLAGAGVWLGRPQAGPALLTASGTVESDDVTLASEAAGLIAELAVDEGDRVNQNQLVARIADPVLDVQFHQAVTDPATQQVTQAQLAKLEVHSPLTGIVEQRLVHQGEVVGIGTPLLTVADPTNLKLTLYVLEGNLGRVNVGQSVEIRADPFPDRVFTGRVTTIADQAEFTPRNVQTQSDRQNLVFGITVRVPNPDTALKAGLPVDATFQP